MPLFVQNTSQLFLDTVQDNIELVAITAPKTETKLLPWSIQFINPRSLEDKYVEKITASTLGDFDNNYQMPEIQLRERFRHYMRQFRLYKDSTFLLDLEIELKRSGIVITEGS